MKLFGFAKVSLGPPGESRASATVAFAL